MTATTKGFLHATKTSLLYAIFSLVALVASPALGQKRHVIIGITVQPHQEVLAANTSPPTSINLYGGLASLADEHTTIFPPSFSGPNDYVFFVASKTALQTLLQDKYAGLKNQGESGLVVLQGPKPNAEGVWTLDYAPAYGIYGQSQGKPLGSRNAQVFLPAMAHLACPSTLDETFDLNYAAGGQVVIDPTVGANDTTDQDGMLFIYEGTNRCIDVTGSTSSPNFYATIGIATSGDNGLHWPAYRTNHTTYTPPKLPEQDTDQGPNLINGAMGSGVCFGNICKNPPPPPTFGRYAVLDTTVTIPMVETANLTANMGTSEPSAFVDNVSQFNNGMPYLYIVHSYNPGSPGLGSGPFENPPQMGRLMIARAQLNGGTAPLLFWKWYGTSVSYPTTSGSFDRTLVATHFSCGILPCFLSNAGLGTNGPLGEGDGGGLGSPVFPTIENPTQSPTYYQTCQSSDQVQLDGSISYVAPTEQYLLIFVCSFPPNIGPDGTQNANYPQGGAAWFFSTLDATRFDLTHQEQWTPPQIILTSWQPFPSSSPCSYDGWYPSLMSLNSLSTELQLKGYAFSMDGCLDQSAGQPREFVSRSFRIVTN